MAKSLDVTQVDVGSSPTPPSDWQSVLCGVGAAEYIE